VLFLPLRFQYQTSGQYFNFSDRELKFVRQIPFSKVVCDGNELKYIREVLKSGWLTTAEKTHRFEIEFAAFVNARYAYAVNSCTAALHLALEALGVGPGDKVLVPTMTFTATAEVVRYLGADPIFLDVEYGSCLVDRTMLTQALSVHSDAKVFMPVHYGGQAVSISAADGMQRFSCRYTMADKLCQFLRLMEQACWICVGKKVFVWWRMRHTLFQRNAMGG